MEDNTEDEYCDGPAPSFEERAKNLQFIVEHLETYPNSYLKEYYPHLANLAIANKAYRDLNDRFNSGKINEADYQIELEKIATPIDISGDFE